MKISLSQLIRVLLVRDVNALTDKEKAVETTFLKFWPKAKPHLRSFREKPNCDCRYDIMEAVREGKEHLAAFLQIVGKPELEIDLNTGDSVRAPVTIRGVVKDIPDTPEAYSALMQECSDNNLRFVGVTVRELKPGTVRVYFF